MIREIVTIDQDRCDGCGLCVPACEEGAIKIVHGKAQLAADNLCDGLGACLGHCPQDAIRIERREADAFDLNAVEHAAAQADHSDDSHVGLPVMTQPQPAPAAPHAGGCPGSRMMQFHQPAAPATAADADTPSALRQWPVQINLLPPNAPSLQNARLLIAADCVPVAYAGFHQKLLAGRTVLIGCPKFDDLAGYVERLAAIFAHNTLREVVVARMQVPCCTGIFQAVLEARRRTNSPTPIREIVVSVEGDVLLDQVHAPVPSRAPVS
jgi:NAD-dependent dihydropyrimidine dehydrogenase PreA subunit